MMKNTASITVLITAYNAEKTIAESLQSILEQKNQDFQIIIVDDCSTDSTYEICKSYVKTHKNITLIRNDTNRGVGASRATAINMVETEFLAIQDADDISLPNRLGDQLSLLRSDRTLGVVGGSIIFFDESRTLFIRDYSPKDSDLRSKIFMFNPVANPAAMYRTEVFDVVGNFNPDLRVCEDLEFLLRLGTRYKFANLVVPVLLYRQSNNSLTRSKMKEMELTSIRLRYAFSNHLAYNFRFIDFLFLRTQKFSLWITPKFRYKIFSILRGDFL